MIPTHLIVAATQQHRSASCGVERQAVKVGADQQAGRVVLKPKAGSVALLRGVPAPGLEDGRTAWEYLTYTVDADLVEVKHESDGDLHLVLRAGALTMIAEVPALRCVPVSSPFYKGVERARKQMEGIHPGPVRVTGVLFFDFIHGQTGVAPNGVELHPVLDIQQR